MLNYSRNVLLSFQCWWKLSARLDFQTSRHGIVQHPVKPLSQAVWDSIKAAGILRSFRGNRGGRQRSTKHQIRSIKPWNRPKPICNRSYNGVTGVERRTLSSSLIIRTDNNLIQSPQQDCIPNLSKTRRRISFGLWNARSINRKSASICDLVITENLDILAITETWLPDVIDQDPTVVEVLNNLQDYDIHHRSRNVRNGGGSQSSFGKVSKLKKSSIRRHLQWNA